MIEEGQQLQEQQVIQDLPEYGMIQGQKIKLGGLDYSLLQKQKNKNNKAILFQKIKNKIHDYSLKLPVDTTSSLKKVTADNDLLTKNILLIKHIKPTINNNTFYHFPILTSFSAHYPQIIVRRLGKMQTQPVFLQHKLQDIQNYLQKLQLDQKIKTNNKAKHLQSKKILKQLQVDLSDSQDDIFGSSSNKQQKKNVTINIGEKINLGVNDEEIFGGKRYRQLVQQIQQQPKAVNKYEFLSKKSKPNQQLDDGYGQCYYQSGPSLQQMKQLRKEGIQIFGQAKQFKQKQRKYNVHKDYQKIKRIIQQKSKKT